MAICAAAALPALPRPAPAALVLQPWSSSPGMIADLAATALGPVLVAPFVGSFLGVVVTRAEAPLSILRGRSRCAACGHVLGPLELVPILSWLVQRGRCRRCDAAIGLLAPGMELAALAIALWTVSLTADAAPDGALIWTSCLLGWLLLALAAIDLRLYLLPDFLTLPLLALGLGAAALLAPWDLAERALGALAGLAFVLVLRQAYWWLRRREGIGLGDAKLLAAAGAWVGWDGLPSVVLVAALAGLAGALLHRARGARVRSTDPVPFGAFLCLGTWIVWLYGPLA